MAFACWLLVPLGVVGCGPASGPAEDLSPASLPALPDGWVSELQRDHPLVGTLWNVREAREAQPRELVASALDARYVLLGEVHDNPDHHRLQAWIVEAMAEQGAEPAIAFEMIRVDRTDALEAYLRNGPRGAEGIGPAVGWEEEGWPDWALYQPIAEAALEADLPLMAADVARTEQEDVSRGGLAALEASRREALVLDRELPAEEREALEEELVRAHCGHLPEHAAAAVAEVQRLRDAAMADRLITAAERAPGDQAILVAGHGHVRADRGVPWYLTERGEGERVLAVGFLQVAEGRTEIEPYVAGEPGGPRFDYVWLTPRPHDRDFCAELEERLRGGG